MTIGHLIGILKQAVGCTSLGFRAEVLGEDIYLKAISTCMAFNADRQDEIRAVISIENTIPGQCPGSFNI